MALPVYDSAQARRPLITELQNLWNYRGLIRLLVNRELTVRYKRSALGVWWTLLNPLITTAIMWLVFGQIFGSRFGETGAEPYVLYLLAGVLFITFFSQGLLATGAAITGSASILTKVYVPAEVFSFATSIAGGVNFLISLIPLVIVQLITGEGIPWTIVLVPIPILAMLALVTGLGMLIAAGAVFFYDVLELSRVAVTLLTYLTPVFYPIEIYGRFLGIAQLNPLFAYLEVFRSLMYRGTIPPLWQWAMLIGTALAALALGVWFFFPLLEAAGVLAMSTPDGGEPLIDVQTVSLSYQMAHDRAGTLKEFTMQFLRKQVRTEQFFALRDVSFQVERGEVFSLIGANGAGKTTLMKIVARVLPPTEGRVVVRGVLAPMIALGAGFNPEMAGFENIVLFGTLLGRSPQEMRERAPAIAEWAELTEFLDVPIRSYSSGMLARLGFAVAADVDPDVLVVDEVLAVGDESFQRKSAVRMQALMNGGTAVLLVSHDLHTVETLSNRVLWLDHGHVRMLGDPKEVVEAYRASV